jgi:LacI family transcriptional regulator
MARTTIDDVAVRAGVSIKTVSRVLNDEPGVRSETRDRVRAVMTALNYHPSLPARSLAGRRSNLLGLVYENPSANYVFDVQNGAMAKCRDANRRLFVLSCNDLGDLTVGEVLAMAEQTHVDGLVLTPPLSTNHALIAALDEQGVIFVRVAPDALDHPSPKVEIDDRAAAREMTEHLLALGHQSIAFVAGHPDHYSTQLRLEGFYGALAAHGLDAGRARVEGGFNTVQSGADAARRLLGSSDRPTAIFASNDDMAAGVMRVAHELGIDVPRRLSVAGFDDTELAHILWPPLTTVHQPSYDMAYTATDLLIRMVRGQDVPAATMLEHKLVIRGSTAPLGQVKFLDSH